MSLVVRLSKKRWSPYFAGVVIGILQIPAFWLIGTALGASSAYVTLAAHVVSWVDPAASGLAYFAKHLSGAKNWWQVALLVGVALGALVSSRLSGAHSRSPSGSNEATPVKGSLIAAFLGGFVMLLGARIADGCTSGHGVSGFAQLSVGSMVAIGAMFAGGIATAWVLKREGRVSS